jgi:hypothetical protein
MKQEKLPTTATFSGAETPREVVKPEFKYLLAASSPAISWKGRTPITGKLFD